jgi:hypothetical protein
MAEDNGDIKVRSCTAINTAAKTWGEPRIKENKIIMHWERNGIPNIKNTSTHRPIKKQNELGIKLSNAAEPVQSCSDQAWITLFHTMIMQRWVQT